MGNGNKQNAASALLEYYRIKYPVKAQRIAALKAAYVTLYESQSADMGKVLSGTSADGVSATWMISMPIEEQLSVYSSAIKQLEGRSVKCAVLFARDRYESGGNY